METHRREPKAKPESEVRLNHRQVYILRKLSTRCMSLTELCNEYIEYPMDNSSLRQYLMPLIEAGYVVNRGRDFNKRGTPYVYQATEAGKSAAQKADEFTQF